MILRNRCSRRPRRARPTGALASAAIAALGFALSAPMSRAHEGSVCLADGRRLHYTEYGDPGGRLVLLFHGTPGSSRDARAMAEELRTARVRLIAPSRPGIGRSTFDPTRRILDWPRDVDQLVAHVAAPGARFSILGMSGGTPYTLVCARAMPYRIDQVVIASGYAPPGVCAPATGASRALDFLERRPRLARLGIGLMGRRIETKPDNVLKHVMNSWSETDRQLVYCSPALRRELIGTLQEATLCGPDGVILDARLLGSPWGFCVAEAVGPPISLFHGCEDAVAPVAMAHWLQSQLPGSELVLDPRAGHLSTLLWHIEEILARFESPGAGLPLK